MIKLGNEFVVMFDVDGTLIAWEDPIYTTLVKQCTVEMDGRRISKYVMENNVEELKRQKESGSQVIVWSASGGKWAEAVVKALGLEDYVDVCMSKPVRMYDDLDPKDYLPKPRHFDKSLLSNKIR